MGELQKINEPINRLKQLPDKKSEKVIAEAKKEIVDVLLWASSETIDLKSEDAETLNNIKQTPKYRKEAKDHCDEKKEEIRIAFDDIIKDLRDGERGTLPNLEDPYKKPTGPVEKTDADYENNIEIKGLKESKNELDRQVNNKTNELEGVTEDPKGIVRSKVSESIDRLNTEIRGITSKINEKMGELKSKEKEKQRQLSKKVDELKGLHELHNLFTKLSSDLDTGKPEYKKIKKIADSLDACKTSLPTDEMGRKQGGGQDRKEYFFKSNKYKTILWVNESIHNETVKNILIYKAKKWEKIDFDAWRNEYTLHAKHPVTEKGGAVKIMDIDIIFPKSHELKADDIQVYYSNPPRAKKVEPKDYPVNFTLNVWYKLPIKEWANIISHISHAQDISIKLESNTGDSNAQKVALSQALSGNIHESRRQCIAYITSKSTTIQKKMQDNVTKIVKESSLDNSQKQLYLSYIARQRHTLIDDGDFHEEIQNTLISNTTNKLTDKLYEEQRVQDILWSKQTADLPAACADVVKKISIPAGANALPPDQGKYESFWDKVMSSEDVGKSILRFLANNNDISDTNIENRSNKLLTTKLAQPMSRRTEVALPKTPFKLRYCSAWWYPVKVVGDKVSFPSTMPQSEDETAAWQEERPSWLVKLDMKKIGGKDGKFDPLNSSVLAWWIDQARETDPNDSFWKKFGKWIVTSLVATLGTAWDSLNWPHYLIHWLDKKILNWAFEKRKGTGSDKRVRRKKGIYTVATRWLWARTSRQIASFGPVLKLIAAMPSYLWPFWWGLPGIIANGLTSAWALGLWGMWFTRGVKHLHRKASEQLIGSNDSRTLSMAKINKSFPAFAKEMKEKHGTKEEDTTLSPPLEMANILTTKLIHQNCGVPNTTYITLDNGKLSYISNLGKKMACGTIDNIDGLPQDIKDKLWILRTENRLSRVRRELHGQRTQNPINRVKEIWAGLADTGERVWKWAKGKVSNPIKAIDWSDRALALQSIDPDDIHSYGDIPNNSEYKSGQFEDFFVDNPEAVAKFAFNEVK